MRGWLSLAMGVILIVLTAPDAIRKRSARDGLAALLGVLMIAGAFSYL